MKNILISYNVNWIILIPSIQIHSTVSKFPQVGIWENILVTLPVVVSFLQNSEIVNYDQIHTETYQHIAKLYGHPGTNSYIATQPLGISSDGRVKQTLLWGF